MLILDELFSRFYLKLVNITSHLSVVRCTQHKHTDAEMRPGPFRLLKSEESSNFNWTLDFNKIEDPKTLTVFRSLSH